jgi:hypothetical protein
MVADCFERQDGSAWCGVYRKVYHPEKSKEVNKNGIFRQNIRNVVYERDDLK